MAVTVTGQIFITATFCGIVALFLYHFGRRRLYIAAAKLPGPRALPIIGSGHYFVGNFNDILNKFQKLTDLYPSPFKIWMGGRLYIWLYDANQIQTILLSPKCIEKDDLYKFLQAYLGTGLLTAPASKWRINRKLLTPMFHSKILEKFVETFARQSEIMTREMRKELQADEFEIHNYVSLCMLDIAYDTILGVSSRAQVEKNNHYVKSAQIVLETSLRRAFKIWLQPNFIFNFTKLARNQRQCEMDLHVVTNDIMRMKRNACNNDIRVENVNAYKQPGTKKAFLDLLIELSENGSKLTDEDIKDEIATLMISGTDTITSVTVFVLLMLASYPAVQERAYQELCEIYGDEVSSKTPVRNEDLNRMQYLERIVKESMRLFPPGPLIGRKITEDIDIEGYTLPKGSGVGLQILALHRSEKYWTDPLKFDPDRFLPEEVEKRHPYCYVPFSAGPRNCMGMRYAMMSVKVLLATVLRRYILKKDKIVDIRDIQLKMDVALKPLAPVTLSISERTPMSMN